MAALLICKQDLQVILKGLHVLDWDMVLALSFHRCEQAGSSPSGAIKTPGDGGSSKGARQGKAQGSPQAAADPARPARAAKSRGTAMASYADEGKPHAGGH
jgi:hypothetical protein